VPQLQISNFGTGFQIAEMNLQLSMEKMLDIIMHWAETCRGGLSRVSRVTVSNIN